MADLMRWAWWRLRRVDWGMAGAVSLAFMTFGVLVWVTYLVFTEPPTYRCDVIQRSIDAHEECMRHEGCIYEARDVRFYYNDIRLIETYCQGDLQ